MNDSDLQPAQVLNDVQMKAFEVAVDTSKQLVTLSTAILTVTVAFTKDIVGIENLGTRGHGALVAAWVAFTASVLFGAWFLYATVGTLGKKYKGGHIPSVYGKNMKLPTLLQQMTFVAGLGLTVYVGYLGL